MDTKYLKTFKTILETGSFQRAAEQLNYAQSTVTLQIQLLEQELSVKLFDKIGRKMKLTQAGEELLPYIDAVLEAVSQLENYNKSDRELAGTLRIAMPETLLSYQMQPVLKKFHEQAPHVKLSLQTGNCYLIREQIIYGSIDIGIHYDIGGYGASLNAEPLGSYPLSLIAGAQLAAEECDFVTTGQRKNTCLLTVDKSSLYHRIFDDYLRKSDIVLNGEMEISSIEAIKRSVSSNLGVAFLPRFTVTGELAQGMVKELSTNMNASITAMCTCHKNKSITPAMSLFMRILKEETKNKREE